MTGNNKQPKAGTGAALLAAGAAYLLLCFGVWLAVRLAEAPGYDGSAHIIVTFFDVATGDITWTATASWIAAAEAAVVAAIAGVVWWRWGKRAAARGGIDAAAPLMATRRDLTRMTAASMTESAKRLHPDMDITDVSSRGVFVGTTVNGGHELYQSWEDCSTDIWGPRKGKTTARAIPAVVAAPGPVVATSRKADLVDATRGAREAKGRVWVFDPQSMLDDPQGFWWNPLAEVTTVTAARRLAVHFMATDDKAQTDSYFGPESAELCSNLLLAAAVSGRTVLDAFYWSTKPRDNQPVRLLNEAGFPGPATSVEGVIALPDKTRGGVYGGTKRALSLLTEPAFTRWVTPPTNRDLPVFDPVAHVDSTDTLYLLSESGPGSPAPLIAALVDTVFRAGEARARQLPSRRLVCPLLSVLDEAANIVRIKEIPQYASYFGSAAMPFIVILQSFAQGVEVWGREGMAALWSACNVRVLGGGVADADFLENQSKFVGEYDERTRSVTLAKHGTDRSVNTSMRRRRILETSDLTALPDGRIVVLPSGSKPVLARTRPWWDTAFADDVRGSLARFDPARQRADAYPDTPSPVDDEGVPS